jgi:hypothetical protein
MFIRIAAAGALAVSLAACSGHADAVTRKADPANVNDILKQAHPGDTVVLAAGKYTDVGVGKRDFSPSLTIDARAADITGFKLGRVSGVTILGGTYRLGPPGVHPRSGRPTWGYGIRLDGVERIKVSGASFIGPGADDPGPEGPFGEGYGLFLVTGKAIEVGDNKFRGFKSGIVLTRVDGFQLVRNTFAFMRSDGMQVAESRNGLIEANVCGSTRIETTEHPDCIQMWSRPTSPPTADVVIRKNKMDGGTQGVGLFNHTRDGVDDGGFDRITVEDNDINVAFPQAISLMSGRDSVVRNNRVSTYPGAKYRASINTGPGVARCGNSVGKGADRPAMSDPPC